MSVVPTPTSSAETETARPSASPWASGAPRFADARWADRAREQGPISAWQTALASRDLASVAATTGGDFAVALPEAPGRTALAVDRFAIRTLCYRVDGTRLRFAPRADQLADAGTEIDLQAIFDYLYFHCIPSPRTIFKGVYRLPPAHCGSFDSGTLNVASYWTPEFQEPRQADFEALRQEFRHLLEVCVQRQLDEGKPACFLSGGTDSSTVAGMIGRVAGRSAATYSIGFAAAGYDEMEYARITARHFGTEHHEYYVTPEDLVRSIPQVAASYDQPFGNSSALPAHYCARMAAADGVSKLLAGDGGDELFGGNSRYARQRVFGWYQALPAAMRRGLMEPLFESSTIGRMPILKKGTSYVEQAKVPMPDRLQMYNLLLRLDPAKVLTPAFLSRIDSESPARQQREVWARARAGSDINRMLAYDWRYTLAESDLPKVCGTTALAGVEVGFPFLDQDLLEFSMRLPPEFKLKRLTLRWFFKEALRGFLADATLSKKKQGFGLPFGVWVNRHPALQALAFDSLRSFGTRGVLRSDFIDALIDTHLPAHPSYYGEMVWIVMMLEQWLRSHAPDFRA
jgi:asparagine synthase (glutamine-hydrolysing)